MLVINLAFILFFLFCVILIALRLRELKHLGNVCKKEQLDKSKVRLYNNDKELSFGCSGLCVDRLADTSVRGSVRFHKGLYKEEREFEEYKKEVMKLKLP